MAVAGPVPGLETMLRGGFGQEFFDAPVLLSKSLATELRKLADRIETMGEHINVDNTSIPLWFDERAKYILKRVAEYWETTPRKIRSRNRTEKITTARHVAMYLCRRFAELSYPDIGECFGRDHATAMYGCKAIEKRIKGEPFFARSMQKLVDTLDFSSLTNG